MSDDDFSTAIPLPPQQMPHEGPAWAELNGLLKDQRKTISALCEMYKKLIKCVHTDKDMSAASACQEIRKIMGMRLWNDNAVRCIGGKECGDEFKSFVDEKNHYVTGKVQSPLGASVDGENTPWATLDDMTEARKQLCAYALPLWFEYYEKVEGIDAFDVFSDFFSMPKSDEHVLSLASITNINESFEDNTGEDYRILVKGLLKYAGSIKATNSRDQFIRQFIRWFFDHIPRNAADESLAQMDPSISVYQWRCLWGSSEDALSALYSQMQRSSGMSHMVRSLVTKETPGNIYFLYGYAQPDEEPVNAATLAQNLSIGESTISRMILPAYCQILGENGKKLYFPSRCSVTACILKSKAHGLSSSEKDGGS